MSIHLARKRSLGGVAALLTGAALVSVVVACSSDDTSNNNPGTDAGAKDSTSGQDTSTGTDSAPPPADTGPTTCSNPGSATQGPADTHCQGQQPQPVSAGSCFVDAAADDAGGDDAGDDGGGDTCDYGDTMFGQEGDDDDCKYHVKWSASPICEGNDGVTFTVNVTTKTDGAKVTGIPQGIRPEVFIPTTLDAACDDQSTHPSPSKNPLLVETPAGSGTYVGKVIFDAPGEWTVRFHIHEECADLLEDSPHGHAAFHVTVP